MISYSTWWKWQLAVAFCILMLPQGNSAMADSFSQVRKAWNNWNAQPVEAQVQAVELEIERFFYRFWKPSFDQAKVQHITAQSLQTAIASGANWLVRMQEPSGRYHYWYDPLQNQTSPRQDDNFLRQAGTAYSMMLAYESTGNPIYMDSAQRNLRHLIRFRRNFEDDKAYFKFRGKVKLGGISLPMLSMLKIRELTGSQEYDELLQKLANMILWLQQPYGTGQYKSTYVYRWRPPGTNKIVDDYEYEKNSGWESKIYPGEAMLALVTMYRAFPDPRYKQSVDWALEFYSDDSQWQYHAFLSWTITAFVSLYEQTEDRRYADYVYRLSDYLLGQQNIDSDDEVYGSFHSFPSANTATYLEGLGDAIRLASLLNDQERLELYTHHMLIGFRWLFRLQYQETNIQGMSHPERALGGIRPSPYSSKLRIDYTQHTISAFIKGLHFIFNEPPQVTSSL